MESPKADVKVSAELHFFLEALELTFVSKFTEVVHRIQINAVVIGLRSPLPCCLLVRGTSQLWEAPTFLGRWPHFSIFKATPTGWVCLMFWISLTSPSAASLFPPAREFSLLLRVHMMKTRLLSTLQGNVSILRTMTLITSAKSLLRCAYVCVWWNNQGTGTLGDIFRNVFTSAVTTQLPSILHYLALAPVVSSWIGFPHSFGVSVLGVN